MHLHPDYLPDDDKTFDVTLYKAVIVNEIKMEYKADEKVVYEVEFLGLIDETKENGNRLGCIGDPSAT